MSNMWRSRWAAVGAAVAITLGAGGISLVDAAKDSGERAVYTAIEPCRLLDTRPNQNIQRNTPLGEGETYPVTAIGDNGQCTGIPNDTVALELNVTGLLNTLATDFVVWSGAGAAPNASHINLALGAPPTPNSVTTELDGNSFSIRNKFGNAHVIVDIVGVYQDHTHDDRYYTEDEVDGVLAAKSNSADTYTKDEVDARLDARLPIASAFINGDGTLQGGFGVEASSIDGSDKYIITLEGVSYVFNEFVTHVTGTCEDRIPYTAGIGGDLVVTFDDDEGARQDCNSGFALTVYELAD